MTSTCAFGARALNFSSSRGFAGNTFEFKGLKEPTPAQLLARR